MATYTEQSRNDHDNDFIFPIPNMLEGGNICQWTLDRMLPLNISLKNVRIQKHVWNMSFYIILFFFGSLLDQSPDSHVMLQIMVLNWAILLTWAILLMTQKPWRRLWRERGEVSWLAREDASNSHQQCRCMQDGAWQNKGLHMRIYISTHLHLRLYLQVLQFWLRKSSTLKCNTVPRDSMSAVYARHERLRGKESQKGTFLSEAILWLASTAVQSLTLMAWHREHADQSSLSISGVT